MQSTIFDDFWHCCNDDALVHAKHERACLVPVEFLRGVSLDVDDIVFKTGVLDLGTDAFEEFRRVMLALGIIFTAIDDTFSALLALVGFEIAKMPGW